MAKSAAATIYSCSQCDAQHPKWLGQCTTCGAWGTLTATRAPVAAQNHGTHLRSEDIPALDTVDPTPARGTPSGIAEFDAAIGGGIVAGSLLLLAGEPGVGKSTLLLQVAHAHTAHGTVLYVSGEETAGQIRMRAERLGGASSHIRVLTTTNAQAALDAITTLKPALAIIDSIQTLSNPDLPADAGGVTHIRTLANTFLAHTKTTNVPTIIVGHVTKDGAVAGPKTLEHLVDQVAVLEGDPDNDLRYLRMTKNRYGPTDIVGVFTHTPQGLVSCPDPAAAFLGASSAAVGTATAAVAFGNRTLLVEIQALVVRTHAGPPQRRSIGVDINRLHVLLAVLARHGNIPLGAFDVHVATSAGIRIDDPAADLAIVSAIASAATNHVLPFQVAIGTVHLDGSIRPIRSIERRIQEAVRIGRTRIAAPRSTSPITGAHLTTCDHLRELTSLFRTEAK
ncbi:DNA repair protein RadA [Candidatus Uhrbacteria bacterium]|nr:DNA repair protein RadA [Candidatus Uhrbacteria bacterium]